MNKILSEIKEIIKQNINEYFAIDCCTTGLEDSYCKASSLYEFIKNWDKQFEGLEEV